MVYWYTTKEHMRSTFFIPVFTLVSCFNPHGTDLTDPSSTQSSSESTGDKPVPTTGGTTSELPTTSTTFTDSTNSTNFSTSSAITTFDETDTDISTSTTSSSTSSESTTESLESTSTGENLLCGNGRLDPEEECDDALIENCLNCYKDRIVFITSVKRNPAEMFQKGYVQICHDAASTAGILNYGFVPILNFTGKSFWDTFNPTKGRYILTSGQIFAEKVDDIKKNMILNPPIYDEFGIQQFSYVWTGGTTNDSENCGSWSINEGAGLIGQSDSIIQWLEIAQASCNQKLPVYCIQDKLWWTDL